MLVREAGLVALAFAAVAAPAARAEEPELADLPEPPPERLTNSGFGLGLAYLSAVNPASLQRFGPHLELRREEVLGRDFQFNLILAAGLTTPENTVALLEWGWDAGGAITGAFGDVSDWVRDGEGPKSFRQMSAFFAYIGLGMSYVAVPVVWVVSPLASIGHAVAGPTVSWHTGPAAPDAFVEVGLGAMLYGDPVLGGPAVGYGPIVGCGAQIANRSVHLRAVVSPPEAHADSGDGGDWVLSAGALVGL